MPLLINLVELKEKDLSLEGSLSAEELDLNTVDELIHTPLPLTYELEAEFLDDAVLVQGWWSLPLECECARCLKKFPLDLEATDWACHLPLLGEDRVPVQRDSVDLTPYLREDILLMLPQHPLCEPECSGLKNAPPGSGKKPNGAGQTDENSGAWAELNKLKL
jgi:uncharacterized metal-binding protein YceD (DUF177 family)